MKRCPICNHGMPDSFSFCGICGKPLSGQEPSEHSTDSTDTKPETSEESESDTISNVSLPEPIATSSTPEPNKPIQPSSFRAPKAQAMVQTAQNATTQKSSDFQSSPHQQSPIFQPSLTTTYQSNNNSTYVKPYSSKICPNCNTVVLVSDEFCRNCGKRFSLHTNSYTTKKKHTPNLPAIIASISFGIAVFLPYVSASLLGVKMQVSLFERVDGYVFLALAAFSLLFSILGRNVGTIVLGTLDSIATAIESWYTIEQIASSDAKELFNQEIGFYVLIISALFIFIFGIVGEKKSP